MDVVVAGQGYVGLPLAVRAAEVGHRVVGYDVDQHRIKQLTASESYVEDVASSRLRAVLDSGAYSATDDACALAGFDIAVITVPTPLRDGVPDLSYVESCAWMLGESLRPGATVALESPTAAARPALLAMGCFPLRGGVVGDERADLGIDADPAQVPGAVDHVLAGVDRRGRVPDIVEDCGDAHHLPVGPEHRGEDPGLLEDAAGVRPEWEGCPRAAIRRSGTRGSGPSPKAR